MRIDHKLQRVQVESFEISDELVYHYFNSLPDNERESALLRAIRIGVLAAKRRLPQKGSLKIGSKYS